MNNKEQTLYLNITVCALMVVNFSILTVETLMGDGVSCASVALAVGFTIVAIANAIAACKLLQNGVFTSKGGRR